MENLELECNLLVYNNEEEDDEDKGYSDPVLDKLINGEKKKEKYLKTPFTFFPADVRSFYKDKEIEGCTVIFMYNTHFIIELSYEEFKKIRQIALKARMNIIENITNKINNNEYGAS